MHVTLSKSRNGVDLCRSQICMMLLLITTSKYVLHKKGRAPFAVFKTQVGSALDLVCHLTQKLLLRCKKPQSMKCPHLDFVMAAWSHSDHHFTVILRHITVLLFGQGDTSVHCQHQWVMNASSLRHQYIIYVIIYADASAASARAAAAFKAGEAG